MSATGLRAVILRVQEARMVRTALIATLALTPGAMLFPDVDGTSVHLVSPDMRTPGRWRATWWDTTGVAAHSSRDTFAEALDAARVRGAILERGSHVTAAGIDAVTAAFGVVLGLDVPHEDPASYLDAIVTRSQRRPKPPTELP